MIRNSVHHKIPKYKENSRRLFDHILLSPCQRRSATCSPARTGSFKSGGRSEPITLSQEEFVSSLIVMSTLRPLPIRIRDSSLLATLLQSTELDPRPVELGFRAACSLQYKRVQFFGIMSMEPLHTSFSFKTLFLRMFVAETDMSDPLELYYVIIEYSVASMLSYNLLMIYRGTCFVGPFTC